MKKRQAISVSVMIGLGVLMANAAIADAQNKSADAQHKRDTTRRAHDNPPTKNCSDRFQRQRLTVRRLEDA